MLRPYNGELENIELSKPWELSDTQDKVDRLVETEHSFYLASFFGEDLGQWANLKPFGVTVETVTLDDVTTESKQSYKIMDLYESVNGLTFGPKGLPLPRWVELDIGLLASAFFITAMPRERIEAELENTSRYNDDQLTKMQEAVSLLLQKADDLEFDGPIPVAGYCASTTPIANKWNGWSLCTLIPGLGTMTKAMALQAYRTEKLTGVTQWSNRALHVHRNLGATTVKKAKEKLHTLDDTLIYETELYKLDERQPTHILEWGGYKPFKADIEISKEAEESNFRLLKELDIIQNLVKNGHVVSVMRPGRTENGLVPLHISEPEI